MQSALWSHRLYIFVSIQTHFGEKLINIIVTISQNNDYIVHSAQETDAHIFKLRNSRKAIRINSHLGLIQASVWPNRFLICGVALCVRTGFKLLFKSQTYLQIIFPCIWAYLLFNVQKIVSQCFKGAVSIIQVKTKRKQS